MSAMSESARSKAKEKLQRLTRSSDGKIDASGWREPLGESGMVQTGPRPISRRQFRRGGKVHGEAAKAHAGRKPRASGGLTATSLINRNVKDANESRVGTKHIGGMKKGGRAHKMMGGPMMGAGPMNRAPVAQAPAQRPMMGGMRPGMRAFKDGGKVHGSDCTCAKCGGGAVGKKGGGSLSLDGNYQTHGGNTPKGGRLARKGGGRTKKGMNVNIIIAPAGGSKPAMPMGGAPMPPPGAGPVGLHQGVPPPAMPPPGAAPPMGMPPPQMRKDGGRTISANKKYPIESGAGGGLGRLEKARAYG